MIKLMDGIAGGSSADQRKNAGGVTSCHSWLGTSLQSSRKLYYFLVIYFTIKCYESSPYNFHKQ